MAIKRTPPPETEVPATEPTAVVPEAKPKGKSEPTATQSELASALVQALEMAKPPQKKTIANRRKNTPWTTTGVPKTKLKRKFFQHSIPLDPDKLSDEEIQSFNKLRPGIYLGGDVKVWKRRDGGIDIDYPIKTASQRLKLINKHGIVNLKSLVDKCLAETAAPPKPKYDDEGNAI